MFLQMCAMIRFIFHEDPMVLNEEDFALRYREAQWIYKYIYHPSIVPA